MTFAAEAALMGSPGREHYSAVTNPELPAIVEANPKGLRA
jgi:hypothetical protein